MLPLCHSAQAQHAKVTMCMQGSKAHLLVVLGGAVSQAGQALRPGLIVGVGQRHKTLHEKEHTGFE